MIAITSHTGLMKYDANKRFFSINRAYTPGMSRLGATMWTGDISVSWESLAQQPGYAFYAYARRSHLRPPISPTPADFEIMTQQCFGKHARSRVKRARHSAC